MKKQSITKIIIGGAVLLLLFLIRKVMLDRKGLLIGKVLGFEGGAKIVTDSGGLTKYGISQKSNPNVDIRNLTELQAIQIYEKKYYNPLGVDGVLNTRLALHIFDMAVNAGASKAVDLAERITGVKSSSQTSLSPAVVKALNAHPNGVLEYSKEREIFYNSLTTANPAKYSKYLKGWMNRVRAVNKTLLV